MKQFFVVMMLILSASPLTALANGSRDEKTDFRNLIVFIEKNGEHGDMAEGFGHILGLSDELADLKGLESNSVDKNGARDGREFAIISKRNAPESKIACYVKRRKVFDGKSHALWYLLSLKGDLEKAVVVDSKYNKKTGEPIRGSGTPIDLDINSPATQHEFEVELSYWLNKARKPSH